MNWLEKTPETNARAPNHTQQDLSKDYIRKGPARELDIGALVKDVKRRYPKILAHLAE